MRKLFVIGIGAGHPDHLTLQAVKAMNAVDVFFFPDKGETRHDLLRFRRALCQAHVADQNYRIIEIPDPVRDPAVASYSERVQQWHERRALLYEQLIHTHIEEDECAAFLVWGDPMLYDSTLRIIDRILARGVIRFDYEVIPGITSVQALSAAHRIPLNGIGESILITTGRRLSDAQLEKAENVAVMLDANCSFKTLSDGSHEIYWGAYVGTQEQILVSGPLGEVAGTIEAARAQARAQHGWIMDSYLLKRPEGERLGGRPATEPSKGDVNHG